MHTRSIQYDVCVIGSGASGAIMARELADAGFQVALVEKGDWALNRGYTEDSWASQSDASSEDELLHKSWRVYQPDADDDPTFVTTNKHTDESVTRIGGSHDLVGGGTRLYAGAAWRFRERDFKKLSIYGSVDNANNADWPVDYQEMEPFYAKAEQRIRVSGSPLDDPTDPPRSNFSSILRPIELDAYSYQLLNNARRKRFKGFQMPVAIDSENCHRLGMCSGYPCRWSAKSSVDIRILDGKHGSINISNLSIHTRKMAFRIETDYRGLCSGVLCKDLVTGSFEIIKTRLVVLAASAVQTARLLLNSDSNIFPDGLANINGLVGKNLMFHIYSKQLGVFKKDFKFRLNKLVAFHDFYFPTDHGEQFINHCSIQSGSKWGPIKFARKARTPNWGRDFIKQISEEFIRTELLQAAVEDLPRESNCVSLHNKKDMYGMPCPKIIHQYHDMDIAALQYGLTKCAVILQACGAEIKEFSTAHDSILGNNTFHLMGTCRMGFNEDDSVLNKFCQAHAVPNLFVADGSVFPTSAAVNPTLTIQANAFRIADYIIDQAKRQAL